MNRSDTLWPIHSSLTGRMGSGSLSAFRSVIRSCKRCDESTVIHDKSLTLFWHWFYGWTKVSQEPTTDTVSNKGQPQGNLLLVQPCTWFPGGLHPISHQFPDWLWWKGGERIDAVSHLQRRRELEAFNHICRAAGPFLHRSAHWYQTQAKRSTL